MRSRKADLDESRYRDGKSPRLVELARIYAGRSSSAGSPGRLARLVRRFDSTLAGLGEKSLNSVGDSR